MQCLQNCRVCYVCCVVSFLKVAIIVEFLQSSLPLISGYVVRCHLGCRESWLQTQLLDPVSYALVWRSFVWHGYPLLRYLQCLHQAPTLDLHFWLGVEIGDPFALIGSFQPLQCSSHRYWQAKRSFMSIWCLATFISLRSFESRSSPLIRMSIVRAACWNWPNATCRALHGLLRYGSKFGVQLGTDWASRSVLSSIIWPLPLSRACLTASRSSNVGSSSPIRICHLKV